MFKYLLFIALCFSGLSCQDDTNTTTDQPNRFVRRTELQTINHTYDVVEDKQTGVEYLMVSTTTGIALAKLERPAKGSPAGVTVTCSVPATVTVIDANGDTWKMEGNEWHHVPKQ